MDVEFINQLTHEALPDLDGGPFQVRDIAKGGSGRQYFRLRNGNGTLIFCQYDLDRPENSRFELHTDFLAQKNVAVPKILARDPENRRLWIEDLGEQDLWSFHTENWDTRRGLYEKALEMVSRIHALTEATVTDLPILGPEFNEGMYEWEQDYFFDNFVANFSAASPETIEQIRRSPELTGLQTKLATPPRCLIHRDFQSQNVIIRDNGPVFIDYQGLRFGLAEYDLASLIYDPYVPLAPSEREHLIAYCESKSSTPNFRRQFFECACQRLMQALGAYGYLGLEKGKREFLDHIEPAIANLREIAIGEGALPMLEPILVLANAPLRA